MAFLVLRFEAEGAIAERWADALLAAGALSVDLTDPAAGTPAEEVLYDVPAGTAPPLWRSSRMTVLLPDGADIDEVVALAAGVVHEPLPAYSIDTVADADWVRETQAQFQPIRVTKELWIVPSWCRPVDPAAINIRLDPGLAFGTGSHPTTRLCLRWLAEHLPRGASVLDYGCGSGVLAIAAAKLGAGTVSGVDVDAAAIAASRANAQANGVVATFGLPGESTSTPADVVVANILANPLELLAPLLAQRVADGGRIVLSGILESQANAVAAAYAQWFNMKLWARECDWVVLVGARSAE
jgi:ribosomal protein L11 methyltransferase